jgi:pyruvate,water dikinase
VLGVSAKSLASSICGRIIDELQEPKKRSILIRLKGFLKLLNYLKTADESIEAFEKRLKTFTVRQVPNSRGMLASLDAALPVLNEAYCIHSQSSATSGFASHVLQVMVSGSHHSTPDEEAEATRLMAGATGVESAMLVEQLDDVIDLISEHAQAKVQFQQTTTEAALTWLQSGDSGSAREAFANFLERHGHRSYRELCLREKCWADDPEALIGIMQASIASRYDGSTRNRAPEAVDVGSLSPGLRWILPKAHNAIRRREYTKSMLVEVTNQIKRGYRYLGELLCDEDRLDDADKVFFFTHQELIQYVNRQESTNDTCWNEHTSKRRLALDFQNRLVFDEVCVGQPEPIDLRTSIHDRDGTLVGRPVSCGTVEAVARVAFTVSDATALKSGEILVAPITDVGWTPYFSLISGLITDVGSAVSHGAVIAREYGLPAIVNTRTGTKQIKTGDRIRLDGHTGQVTFLETSY